MVLCHFCAGNNYLQMQKDYLRCMHNFTGIQPIGKKQLIFEIHTNAPPFLKYSVVEWVEFAVCGIQLPPVRSCGERPQWVTVGLHQGKTSYQKLNKKLGTLLTGWFKTGLYRHYEK